jgi:NAD(P)H dehydrogenase (quinone)
MSKIAVIYFSAQGHTHQVAEAVADGAKGVAETQVDLLRIVAADFAEGRWNNSAILETLAAADTIVFGCPTYMGGYAAQFKAFIDACGGIWFKQGWKDKLAAGFTHSQGLSGDKLNTLEGLCINAMQHGMIWIGTGLMVEGPGYENVNRLSSYTGVMAQTFGQDTCNPGDLKTAKLFGERIATITAKWTK